MTGWPVVVVAELEREGELLPGVLRRHVDDDDDVLRRCQSVGADVSQAEACAQGVDLAARVDADVVGDEDGDVRVLEDAPKWWLDYRAA